MKTKKLYSLLISTALALCLAACSASPQVSRETNYYESPQLEGKTTSLVDVSFQMGGGSTDGNPDVPVAEWTRVSVQIDRMTLKPSSGQNVVISGKKTEIDLRAGSKAALTAKIPSDAEFSEIAFGLSVSSTASLSSLPFWAEGILRSGGRFAIDVDLGLLAFKGLNGSLKWTAGDRKSVGVYLDGEALAKTLPWREFQPVNGKVSIDSGMSPAMYEKISQTILSCMAIFADSDADGTLKDAELEAQNKIGEGNALIEIGCQRCDDANKCTTDFCVGDSWCVLTNFLADGAPCGSGNSGTCSLGKCAANGGDYDQTDSEPEGFPIPQIAKTTLTSGAQLALTNDPGDACGKIMQSAPLDVIVIDASGSSSPSGRLPLKYYWEIIEKPDYAVDSAIICRDCFPASSASIEKGWTDESSPKLLLPLAGTYKIRVAVKDSLEIKSSDDANNVSCKHANLTINAAPPKKLFVQLVWDKDDGVDFDLFLSRYRANGTMGVSPNNDYLQTPALTMPASCSQNSDCCPAGGGSEYCGASAAGSGLTCDAGHCVTSCAPGDAGDAYCKKAHPGYSCGSDGVCGDNNRRWQCRDELDVKDGDCKGKGYCLTRMLSGEAKKFCAAYSFAQENDSCAFNNRNPEWGDTSTTADNPVMDIDDVDGYGPEIISITNPGSASAKYRVTIRFYADPNAGVSSGNPVKAFLNIYLNGTACQSKAVWLPFKEVGTYWKAADINWKGDATACGDITILPLNPAPSVSMNDINYAAEALNAQCLDQQNPACEYANPFKASDGGVFNPCDAANPRSIWCDAAGSADCCYKTDSCSCP